MSDLVTPENDEGNPELAQRAHDRLAQRHRVAEAIIGELDIPDDQHAVAKYALLSVLNQASGGGNSTEVD